MSGSLVDASIPLGAKTPPAPNPLDTIGQFANTQNALNSLKMFPGQQQLQQQQIAGGQNSLIEQQKQAAAGMLAPLLASNRPIGASDIAKALGGAEHAGIITQPMASLIAAAPVTGDPVADDRTYRSIILANAQPAASAAGAVVPRNETINTGAYAVPGTTPAPGMPGQGAFDPAGRPIKMGIAPTIVHTGGGNTPFIEGQPAGPTTPDTPPTGDMNQLIPVWNAKTQQLGYKPRFSVAPMVTGAGTPMPGTGGGSSSPASGAPLGTPQEAEASAIHLGQARERANNYQQIVQPINSALSALKQADTGRGSEIINSLHAVAQDLTPSAFQSIIPESVLGDPAKRQAYEEATKYLTQMSINAPGGSRSDSGQAAAGAATPNTHISNAAAQQVVTAMLAQERLKQAGTLAFNQTGAPANQYDRFMNHWNTVQDPRAYIVDQLAPAERAALVKSLGGIKSAAYQKFKNSAKNGVDTQVMPGPNG